MLDTTPIWAKRFDFERSLRLGAGAVLVFLKLDGKDSSGASFSSLKEVPRGWLPSRREVDGAIWAQIEVADLDGDLESIIEGEGHATHFALNGKVFEIVPDQTLTPLVAPMVWRVRGYKTKDAYP